MKTQHIRGGKDGMFAMCKGEMRAKEEGLGKVMPCSREKLSIRSSGELDLCRLRPNRHCEFVRRRSSPRRGDWHRSTRSINANPKPSTLDPKSESLKPSPYNPRLP